MKDLSGRWVAVVAVVLGVALFLMLRGGGDAPVGDSGSGPDPASTSRSAGFMVIDPATAVSPEASTRQPRAPVVESVIRGRVLASDDRPVPGCVVEIARGIVGSPYRVEVAPDRDGYFEFEVPPGSYSVLARAPGKCMFPARELSVDAGGEPVAIRMHTGFALPLRFVDRESGVRVQIPPNMLVQVFVGDMRVPEDVWADMRPDIIRPIDRSALVREGVTLVTRVLGREAEERLSREQVVRLVIQARGMIVPEVLVPAAELDSAPVVRDVLVSARSTMVPVYVRVAHDDGSSLRYAVWLSFQSSKYGEAWFGGVMQDEPVLCFLESGAWKAKVGARSEISFTRAVDIPDVPYSTVAVSLPRGSDVSVSVVSAEGGGHFRNPRLARLANPESNHPPDFDIDMGMDWRSEPHTFHGLVPGTYRVSAVDMHGVQHTRTITLGKNEVVRVVFEPSGG